MSEIEPFPPQHMDRWSRNARLYRRLLDDGLVVYPVFMSELDKRIDYLCVATALPDGQLPGIEQTSECAQGAAVLGVVSPVKRPEVVESVVTPKRIGDNVVDFPTEL